MKRVVFLVWLLFGLNAGSTVAAQEFYPDFAIVVQLPSYETFLTNLGDSPIRVDHYRITSVSASLSLGGWVPLDSAGPEIVAALGPGADEFSVIGGPTPSELAEFNLLGSATWQPGQTWSIGFPFNSGAPNFVFDAAFQFSSPDGFYLPGGTFVGEYILGPGAVLVVPEPSSGVLCLLAAVGIIALWFGGCRSILPTA